MRARAAEGWLPGWPLLEELRVLARGRLCRPEVWQRCRAENSAFADWACEVCEEFRQPEAISPWTWHLLFLFQLQQAGYPFRANDLSLETWLLLGLVRQVWEGAKGGENAPGPN